MLWLSNIPTDFAPFLLKLALSRVDIGVDLSRRLPTNLHNHLTFILSHQNWTSSRPAGTVLQYSNDAERTDKEKESACGSLERKKVSSYLDNENLAQVQQSGNGITLELGDDQKEDVQKAILQNTGGEGLQRVKLPGREWKWILESTTRNAET